MTEFACPQCNRSDAFEQSVSIAIDTERAVRLVVKDGKPSFEPEPVSMMDLHITESDVHDYGVVTCVCGARFKGEDELRVVVDDWQPGDVAILPDGLRSTVATVGPRLTVEGWHEEFDPRELRPLYPVAKSEPLAA